MKRLVITDMPLKGQNCRIMAQEENGRICSVHLEKPGQTRLLGSIHIGKVQKLLTNIKGAFVEIENHLPCYLPLIPQMDIIFTNRAKKSSELKTGDELLVQVTQEALKMKAPCLSSHLSFTGKYLVLTTGNCKLGVSGKIAGKSKERLKSLLEQALPKDRDYGLIVRTNASEVSEEEILLEWRQLLAEKDALLKKGSYSRPFTCLKKGESGLTDELKSLYWDEMEKIVTDLPEVYQQILSFVEQTEQAKGCSVSFYQDDLLPLYKLYRLEHGVQEALQEKIWLRSGGFLVMQQTEAFVSVDVNSGKNSSKKQPEEFYRKLNKEAAAEIARQIRLRNLYGIILIDFINMKASESREELLHLMREYVKTDPTKTVVVDVTALGIMELTRQKEKKSLQEQLQEVLEKTIP